MRKATQLCRDEAWAKRGAMMLMPIMPMQVGGAAAQDVNANNGDAIRQLGKLADELRRSAPELTREQAFSRVYADPNNRALAEAERPVVGDKPIDLGADLVEVPIASPQKSSDANCGEAPANGFKKQRLGVRSFMRRQLQKCHETEHFPEDLCNPEFGDKSAGYAYSGFGRLFGPG